LGALNYCDSFNGYEPFHIIASTQSRVVIFTDRLKHVELEWGYRNTVDRTVFSEREIQ